MQFLKNPTYILLGYYETEAKNIYKFLTIKKSNKMYKFWKDFKDKDQN